jgi:hypothetical protein
LRTYLPVVRTAQSGEIASDIRTSVARARNKAGLKDYRRRGVAQVQSLRLIGQSSAFHQVIIIAHPHQLSQGSVF